MSAPGAPIKLCLYAAIALGMVATDARAQQRDASKQCVVVEVFVSEDSERSKSALEYIEKLNAERPGLSLHIRDVGKDEKALARFWKLAKHFKHDKPGLPAFYLCRQFEVGWKDAATTGPQIAKLLDVEVFVKAGCPRCAATKEFLREITPRYPAFRFNIREVSEPGATQRLQALASQYGVSATSLPAIAASGRMHVGWQSRSITGPEIERLLSAGTVPCRATPTAPRTGALPAHRLQTVTGSSLVGMSLAWAALAQLGESDAPPPPPADSDADPAPPAPTDDARPADVVPGPPSENVLDDEELPPIEDTQQRKEVTVPFFGTLNLDKLGLPLFTFAIGFVDGFNPCAMWVLLLLLSLLVNLKDRKRILAIAGTFVLISGLAYFSFMAAWLTVYSFIPIKREIQVFLGVLALLVGAVHTKDFFAPKRGVSLSIPDWAKPGIYARMRRVITAENLPAAILAASVLAVMVNMLELLCTSGLPAIYVSVLGSQEIPRWQHYAYLALYNVAYMLDDSIVLTIALITLGNRKLQEKEGRWLKLISGAVLILFGLVMLFWPEVLELT